MLTAEINIPALATWEMLHMPDIQPLPQCFQANTILSSLYIKETGPEVTKILIQYYASSKCKAKVWSQVCLGLSPVSWGWWVSSLASSLSVQLQRTVRTAGDVSMWSLLLCPSQCCEMRGSVLVCWGAEMWTCPSQGKCLLKQVWGVVDSTVRVVWGDSAVDAASRW